MPWKNIKHEQNLQTNCRSKITTYCTVQAAAANYCMLIDDVILSMIDSSQTGTKYICPNEKN